MTSKVDNSSDCRVLLSSRIIDKATEMFLAKGIKAVKMDDVANDLSISKRTLYEIFCNKEKLLLHCVQRMRKTRDEHFKRFKESGTHTEIETILEFYRFQLRLTSKISIKFVKELQKYPTVVQWLEESNREKRQKLSRSLSKASRMDISEKMSTTSSLANMLKQPFPIQWRMVLWKSMASKRSSKTLR